MATVKIVMKGAEDKSAIRRSGENYTRTRKVAAGDDMSISLKKLRKNSLGEMLRKLGLKFPDKLSALFLKIIGKSTEMVSRKT